MSAPERIWAWESNVTGWSHSFYARARFANDSAEYVRADFYDTLRAERDALAARVERLERVLQHYAGGPGPMGVTWEPLEDKGGLARAALSTAQEG
jgi:hypothetical protein